MTMKLTKNRIQKPDKLKLIGTSIDVVDFDTGKKLPEIIQVFGTKEGGPEYFTTIRMGRHC